MPVRLHQGELAVDAALVRRLLAEQFPHLAHLRPLRVRSTGTVNALFRLGRDLYARLPLLPEWAESLEREWAWLPRLAPRLSLAIPRPLALGRPAAGYPCPWALYRWIDGRPYAADTIRDETQAALDLANFVRELRETDPAGAPRGGRAPLSDLDGATRAAIAAAGDLVDAPAVSAAWERALAAPPWDGKAVWVHADLLRPNLLARAGRLCAVIDFGGAGAGDPAADVIPAWSVFTAPGRAAFRRALAVADGVWERARGYALHQALLIIPYYARSNPAFTALACRTVAEVLADLAGTQSA